MKVVVFGASGMLGAGVVLECLDDPRVDEVVTVVRASLGSSHPKLREHVRADFLDYADGPAELRGCDACFYCLGVSSVGMSETAYHRITYDMTIAAADAVQAGSPDVTFCFVSGAGSDATERGRIMWARVKGKAENAVLRMGPRAYVFRPGFVQPRRGVRSKTRLYRVTYAMISPLYPALARLWPNGLTTTEHLGRAMIRVATSGHDGRVLESADINALAAR